LFANFFFCLAISFILSILFSYFLFAGFPL